MDQKNASKPISSHRESGQVFDMLPMSVRSRIPAFKFLRRSDCLSIISSQRPLTGGNIEELVVTSHEENQVVQVNGTAVEAGTPVPMQGKEQALAPSGIRWRYAEQGMNIHRIACYDKEDPGFSRKSYIDGVAYMLMALPDDLSDKETATIREALPSCVADAKLVNGRNGRAIGWKYPPENQTFLQRCVANVVAIFVVLIHVALSYATVVVRVGAYYERKYNVSQQIVSRGFVIATTVGRHGVVLSSKICAMRNGRFGKVMSKIASWTIESITCGIQEGIGQGLMMIDTGPGTS
ncbi:hypothetical protein E0Z10_g5771 [Xylaria hypoxylon]|uniref:Uncharacterized protein n=1 Tax=Xylaria hypoxylon TaxID=37992 RepID=A0A4Z0YFA8_9PEZI|nr:hypothetical protein E0Z10_g5771 [Xylaria hypoxylon]